MMVKQTARSKVEGNTRHRNLLEQRAETESLVHLPDCSASAPCLAQPRLEGERDAGQDQDIILHCALSRNRSMVALIQYTLLVQLDIQYESAERRC
jgi:hypothetical protein